MALSNNEILRILKRTITLLELNDENTFKIRNYQNAIKALAQYTKPFINLSQDELAALDGVGKSMAGHVYELCSSGKLSLYNDLCDKIPIGLIELVDLQGVGIKKIRQLWQELNITDRDELNEAIEQNKIKNLKGFGEKTQIAIKNSLLYLNEQLGKLLLPEALALVEVLKAVINEADPGCRISETGALRRRNEVTECLELLVGTTNRPRIIEALDRQSNLEKDKSLSGPFTWRGFLKDEKNRVTVFLCHPQDFTKKLLMHTGSKLHLSASIKENQSLLELIHNKELSEEEDAYRLAEVPFIIPELREGFYEYKLLQEKQEFTCLERNELHGIIHVHSTYSDGKNTLTELKDYCKQSGYKYLGITDHSQTAVYANGLDLHKVNQQHEEIDRINQEDSSFKIFKGIESDILANGELDYSEDVLKKFDFVVASIHSGLQMDVNKATERLLRAIYNPYTTIIGHLTGRILLKRDGYPIDYEKIFQACAKKKVIIEINCNPHRMDLDWRWIGKALEAGVMLSLNPDAHSLAGLDDLNYGIIAARKGAIPRTSILNAMSLEEIQKYFSDRITT